VAGTCECGNETSGSIKCGEFLDQLKTFNFSRRSLFHGAGKLVSTCKQKTVRQFANAC